MKLISRHIRFPLDFHGIPLQYKALQVTFMTHKSKLLNYFVPFLILLLFFIKFCEEKKTKT